MGWGRALLGEDGYRVVDQPAVVDGDACLGGHHVQREGGELSAVVLGIVRLADEPVTVQLHG